MFQSQEQLTNEMEMWLDVRERVDRRIQQALTIEEAVKEEKERYLYGSEQFLKKRRDKSFAKKINTIFYEKKEDSLLENNTKEGRPLRWIKNILQVSERSTQMNHKL